MKTMQTRFTFSVLTLCMSLLLLCNVSAVAQTQTKATANQQTASKVKAGANQSPAVSGATGQKYSLKSSRQVGTIDQVDYKLDIKGKLMAPSEKDPKKMEEYPVAATSQMTYFEKTVFNGQKNKTFAIQAIRNYKSIETKQTIDKQTTTLTLPKEKMQLNVDINGINSVYFHPQYCMTRNELNILEVMGSSLILDTLLPTEPVAVNDEWSIAEETLTNLLQLETLTQAQVAQILTEVKGNTAIVDAQGIAEGFAEGVKTVINFKLKYYFNLTLKRITWAGMVTSEERKSGPVTPDLSIESSVNVTIKPVAPAQDSTLAAAKWTDPTSELLLLHFDAPDGSWSMFHNRNWVLVQNEMNQTFFRYMFNGTCIAECVINKPVDTPQTRAMTLDQFKEQVELAIKEDKTFAEFRKIESSTEDVSQLTNNKVYQIVASDSKNSSMWAYYMVKGKANEQIVFMFMLDSNSAKNIGTTDSEMVGSLTFNSITQPTSVSQPAATK